ncbi:unnamed protein product [Prorocentrum cordatum]|uniref:Peptidase A1 domain-containing protein n=1 Tax=Prorocentrum cordatum TaxID=2364126 RepID=A0ABN9RLK0_9DINO|nr:unnamed protein product [Polarella glacialis]
MVRSAFLLTHAGRSMFGRNALFTFAVLHTLVLSTTALAPQISNNQGDNAATAPPASDQHGKDPAAGIHVISLERDATPLRVKGSVVAFRIAYTGIIRVGSPAQEFKVIFDSGSGQVVLPSNRCEGPICRRLRRYTMSSSTGAFHVELSGQPTPEDGRPDNVEISFGVGHVKGELVRDKFCLGEAVQGGVYPELQSPDTCVRVNGVMATTLSQAPFGLFNFDGIVGLGLPELSLSEDCSFFGSLFKSGVLRARQFGVYLAEGGEGSEIAFGGPNPEKLASPVMWTSVVMPGHGHWQVEIVAFHVGDYTLDVCRSGGCRGVLDTGTSHIAIPSPHEVDVESMLRRDSDGIEDCRYIENPPVVIELRGINLTIYPEGTTPLARRIARLGDVAGTRRRSTQCLQRGGGSVARNSLIGTRTTSNSAPLPALLFGCRFTEPRVASFNSLLSDRQFFRLGVSAGALEPVSQQAALSPSVVAAAVAGQAPAQCIPSPYVYTRFAPSLYVYTFRFPL